MKSMPILGAAGAALMLSVGLTGCNQNSASAGPAIGLSASKYCSPFRTAQASTGPAAPNATDPAAAFEDCAHRWGYALAPARDSADVVAQAVVDACSATLSSWNQQTLNQNPQAGTDNATSLTTGQPTDLFGERTRFAQSRAMFYVVQARAGNCAPPPPSTVASISPPTG